MNNFLFWLLKIVRFLFPVGQVVQKPVEQQSPFDREESPSTLPTYENPPAPPEPKPEPATPAPVHTTLPDPYLDTAIARENPAFVVRLKKQTENSTLSELLHNGTRLCFILEDGFREQKEYGKTRIPAGTYELVKRKTGRFYVKYKKDFGHEYVVELKAVPKFKYILVHIGNTVKDTLGCLLTGLGYSQSANLLRVGESTAAYLKWYAAVDSEFKKGGRVFMRIER